MATSEGIPSSIDIEFLELNDNPYIIQTLGICLLALHLHLNAPNLTSVSADNGLLPYRQETSMTITALNLNGVNFNQ